MHSLSPHPVESHDCSLAKNPAALQGKVFIKHVCSAKVLEKLKLFVPQVKRSFESLTFNPEKWKFYRKAFEYEILDNYFLAKDQ